MFLSVVLCVSCRRYQLRFRKTRKPNWITACNETAARSCDLTPFNLHYLGIFVLRVRAGVGGGHSEWEELEFCPDKDGKTTLSLQETKLPAAAVHTWFTANHQNRGAASQTRGSLHGNSAAVATTDQ